MVFNNNLLLGAAGAGGGYTIDQSIRFNDDDSARLYSTSFSASPTSSTDCTFSTWVKRGNFGSLQVMLYGGNPAGSTAEQIRFDNDEGLKISQASSAYDLKTDQKFRDVAGWYHIVVAFDTDNATASERIKLYVNGERVTSFSTETYPSSGYSTNMTAGGASIEHVLGANSNSGPASQFLDGYQAEINFIDGQALDPTSFGETNADTGQWVPVKYTGSYGTNGFYITGANSADLGADDSGNGNNFTSSGLTAADQMPDTPTNNFCTWNSTESSSKTNMSLQDGNLVANGFDSAQRGTIFVSSGKWYAELTISAAMSAYFGISEDTANMTGNPSLDNLDGYLYYSFNGQKIDQAGSGSAYGSSWRAAGKTVGVAVDMDNGAIWFSVDGVWQNSATISEIQNGTTTNAAFTGISGNFALVYSNGTAGLGTLNAGQSSFSYTQPTGFNAWSTESLPDPTIALPEKYFNTVLYEGNGGGQRVGQFQPITETYTVPNSVIFNKDDPAYLSATLAANASKIWTISFWVKRGKLGADQIILDGGPNATNYERLNFTGANNALDYQHTNGGVTKAAFRTNMVFLDTSRWYNIVLAKDATATDIKLYVDGVQITDFASSTTPVNEDGHFFDNQGTTIGKNNFGSSEYLDAYIAEFYAVVGQQLTASSFGQLDASTNRWIPKDASGLTFGTNGFYLDMETAPGTGSGAGTDSSGNGNNFTESGLAAADQVTDSPTENFATLNPLRKGTNVTLSDGNLVADCGSGSTSTRAFSTVGMPNSGKWTFQIEAVSSTLAGTDSISSIGIISDPYTNNTDVTTGSKIGQTTNQENAGLDFYNGFTKKDNASQITAAQLRNAGDKGIVAYDASTKELWLGYAQSTDSSWTWVGGGDPEAGTSPTYTMSEDNQYFAISTDRSKTIVRFGSNGDGIAPPTGFDYLNNDNLPLSNGELSAFVWIKNRDAVDNHMLFDAVRGVTKDVHSNATSLEATNANTLTRFLKNGFEVSNDAEVNTSGESYAAWQWLNDSLTTSSNSDGDITSTVLANTTAGFSIVTATPSLTGTENIGHGIGIAPKMILGKNLDLADNWYVYHDAISPAQSISLNTTGAPTTTRYNAATTSSVFQIVNAAWTNGGQRCLWYCFAEVEGFSKIGIYTGNGSTDGAFVYTGFKPAFVLWKQYTNLGTNSWGIRDSARDPSNVVESVLRPDTTGTETTASSAYADFLSNGFKLRATDGFVNKASSNYLYMAFAESPFKTANAR